MNNVAEDDVLLLLFAVNEITVGVIMVEEPFEVD